MICIFHLFSDDPDGPARCWGTTGLLLRMAQSVRGFSSGIHIDRRLTEIHRLDCVSAPKYYTINYVSQLEDRNNSLVQQNQKESRRRPRLWWEIAFFDRMQSLFYGRPTGITRR
jgi:hypothetical protein